MALQWLQHVLKLKISALMGVTHSSSSACLVKTGLEPIVLPMPAIASNSAPEVNRGFVRDRKLSCLGGRFA